VQLVREPQPLVLLRLQQASPQVVAFRQHAGEALLRALARTCAH
jgi:hypothetical protein